MTGADIKMDIDDEVEFSIDGQDTKVWLVKVPTFVAQKWAEIGHIPGQQLGVLRIHNKTTTRAGKTEPVVTLHLPNAEWADQTPKNYDLRFTNTAPKNQYVFTENSQGQAVEIAGKIEHEATIGPVIDDDYRRVMQARTEKATTSTRVVQIMDEKQTKTRSMITGASADSWSSATFGMTKKKSSQLDKRERMPRSELIDMIFQEFEKFEFWTFKALAERTRQPQAYLKEILSEICILNKRGPYSGLYQLKPEYSNKSKPSSSSE